MKKTLTPKYRLMINNNIFSAWSVKDYGKCTVENLEKWIYKYIESLKSGGVNYHINERLGYIPIPYSASIVDQKYNKVVVEWNAPAFMAF